MVVMVQPVVQVSSGQGHIITTTNQTLSIKMKHFKRKEGQYMSYVLN